MAYRSLHIDDRVHLTVDLPDLGLHVGEEGSVCSTWFSATAFEVEFVSPAQDSPIRALVREEQIEADEQAKKAADV